MEDGKDEQSGNLSGILADIRKTETPGRSGGVFPYARAIYACFEEIRALKVEGFTLATICKFLERKGALPPGSDPHSFCRAFRRESDRRKRMTKTGRASAGDASGKGNDTTKRSMTEARRESSFPPVINKPITGKAELQINPDNTFRIRPIDPDDLPDVQN